MADTDSENEGCQTNVTRLVIRPPGHTGKAQKGHLAFAAGFECANLGRVDFISETEFDLYIRPDTCNPRHRFWFNFTIENTQSNQRIIFNIVNISKSKNLLAHGLTPVVKSTSRPMWQRMPSSHVFYHRSPLHNKNYVLSWAFCFDREDEVYHFAMCQPYSYTRQKFYTDKLLEKKYNILQRDFIGKSTEERDIELLTISSPENLAIRDNGSSEDNFNRSGLKTVFIFGRIHPGEAPASFVIQGFLDFILSSHEVAECLRSHIVFKVVPMLNPDGVFLGNQRCNILGQDLNRAWAETHRLLHPELIGIKKQLLFYDSHEDFDLDMVIDVHAHTALTGLFIYGSSYDDTYRYERHIVFPKILALNCEDYNSNNTLYNTDTRKSGSARRHMTTYVSEEVNTYTLEVSLLGYNDRESKEFVYYTDELYCRIGRNLSRAFWDYYKITGVIPLEDMDETQSTNSREGSKLTSAGLNRNFNMERLREIAKQREESAETFNDDIQKRKKSSVLKKTSVGSQRTEHTRTEHPRSELRINLMGEPVVNSEDFEDESSTISGLRRLDSSVKSESFANTSPKENKKVMTPVVDLNLNPMSEVRNRRKITLANLPKSADIPVHNKPKLSSEESIESLLNSLSVKRTGSETTIDISGIGPTDESLFSIDTPQGKLSTSSLGSGKKVGGGGVVSTLNGAPRPQYLKPYIQTPLPTEPTLTIIDFGEISKPEKKTVVKKRKRKRVLNKGITKEEFFNRLYQTYQTQ